MILMNLMATLIFAVMLMAVLLIPLLHAAGAYEELREDSTKQQPEYVLLFDVDEEPSSKRMRR